MKKNRLVLTIVLVVLIGFGWISQATHSANKTKEYKENVAKAEMYCNKKLYQKAINLYDDALDIKENEETRNKWFETYALALKAEEITRDEYIGAMKKVVKIYPDRTDLWETLISESIKKMDYKGAKTFYEDAMKADTDKKVISKYKNTIYYSVTENNWVVSTVLLSSQGYATISDGTKWGIVDPSGKWVYECKYDYAGPVINNDYFFLTTPKDSRVYNNSKVAQAILADKDVKTKVIKEGILPICKAGTWTFYDYENEKNILDKYEDVSCFINGKAAVKKNGSWTIINKENKAVSDKKFENIKLLGSGEYAANGIMIASVGGKYGIYDESGKSKCEFTAADMDICMGGNIAFKDSKGKWGFVNASGKTVIEPKFDEAKSFSNGLAAVKSGDKWGFINESGEVVIDYKYSDGGYFTNKGTCFVGLSDAQMYMITLRF